MYIHIFFNNIIYTYFFKLNSAIYIFNLNSEIYISFNLSNKVYIFLFYSTII